MKVSIVIPNYNGGNILGKNLPHVLASLKRNEAIFSEIIISDDSSKDSSIEIVRNFIEENKKSDIKIKLLVSNKNKNLGFSSNVNKGVSAATGDIVVLLNTDVIPSLNFLSPLLKHFDDPSVFAVACMDESIEGEKTINRGRGIGSWKKGFLLHGAGDINKNNTLWVSGGSGAFRRELWEKLDGLNPLFNPFYWEDIDLSYRALKSGYKLIFEKGSIVRHEHEKGVIKRQYSSNKVRRISYRNQLFFVWLNITDLDLLIYHLLLLPYNMIYALLKGDYYFLLGFFTAISRLSNVMKYRKLRKEMFKLSDKEVILPFSKEWGND